MSFDGNLTVSEKEKSVNADGEKQKISKYYLEYRFIPYIVSRFNQKDDADMPLMALYDIRWWEEVLTDKHEAEFDFADIKVTKDYLSNGNQVPPRLLQISMKRCSFVA